MCCHLCCTCKTIQFLAVPQYACACACADFSSWLCEKRLQEPRKVTKSKRETTFCLRSQSFGHHKTCAVTWVHVAGKFVACREFLWRRSPTTLPATLSSAGPPATGATSKQPPNFNWITQFHDGWYNSKLLQWTRQDDARQTKRNHPAAVRDDLPND